MKLVIFGSRKFNDYEFLKQKVEETLLLSNITPTLVISGTCKGADLLGEKWAKENNILIEKFPAKWDDIKAEKALIKTNQYGKLYNARAGFDRNREMAELADFGIGFTVGHSPGTNHMAEQLRLKGKTVYLFEHD